MLSKRKLGRNITLALGTLVVACTLFVSTALATVGNEPVDRPNEVVSASYWWYNKPSSLLVTGTTYSTDTPGYQTWFGSFEKLYVFGNVAGVNTLSGTVIMEVQTGMDGVGYVNQWDSTPYTFTMSGSSYNETAYYPIDVHGDRYRIKITQSGVATATILVRVKATRP